MAKATHPAWGHITHEIGDDLADEFEAAGWIVDKPEPKKVEKAQTRWSDDD